MTDIVDEVRRAFEREEDISPLSKYKAAYVMGAINKGMRMIPPTPWERRHQDPGGVRI